MDTITTERAIHRAMCRYAQALDQRQWQLLDDVFAVDATAWYGGEHAVAGRVAIVALIRSFLDGCGPTQHLLGNLQVERLSADTADSVCYVRAGHRGASGREVAEYTVYGAYRASWQLDATGWRAQQWRLEVFWSSGDASILGQVPVTAATE